MSLYISIENAPLAGDIKTLRRGLARFNIERVPALLDLPDGSFALVLRDNGPILGGAVADFDWGWVFVDTLWVADSARGQGYGQRIMQAVESYAAQRGAAGIYLFTTDFQARPFYERCTYHLFGKNANRPRDHHTYYFYKTALQTTTIDPQIEIQNPPHSADLRILEQGLLNHAAQVAPIKNEKLAIFLRDEQHTRGGIFGGTYWDWFDLHFLWVDATLRGQGYGRQLLQAAEIACRKRGVIGIVADTTSFQALPFFQAQGFRIFATLDNRPPGYESYFIQKVLV